MKKTVVLMCSFIAVLLAATAAYAEDFMVETFVVCSDVENREPVGVSDTFSIGTEKVYAYLEVKNITANMSVDVVWQRNGEEVHRTNLKIGAGSRWRTYAYKNLHWMDGDWKAELRDSAGNVLSSVSFKVK